MIIVSLEGVMAKHALCLKFLVTNNKAEYETFITGLQVVKELEVQDVKVNSDSQLVIKHIKGDYGARKENITKYLSKVEDMAFTFYNFEI